MGVTGEDKDDMNDTAINAYSLWRKDMQANRNCAKGRFVLTLFRFGQALPQPFRLIYKPFYYFIVDMVMSISLPFESCIGGAHPATRARSSYFMEKSYWGRV